MIELFIGMLVVAVTLGWCWVVGHIAAHFAGESYANFADKMSVGLVLSFVIGFGACFCWIIGYGAMSVLKQ